LIYYEACTERQDAEGREKFLKSGAGRRFLRANFVTTSSDSLFRRPNQPRELRAFTWLAMTLSINQPREPKAFTLATLDWRFDWLTPNVFHAPMLAPGSHDSVEINRSADRRIRRGEQNRKHSDFGPAYCG
jgi:hypothetical protein